MCLMDIYEIRFFDFKMLLAIKILESMLNTEQGEKGTPQWGWYSIIYCWKVQIQPCKINIGCV